eukprot:TRINITY_DN36115_c0_g1_i1.p2 TRINITY_DN36115_c0_g1~~TRINITY_DN36115_c0_g1_i1.p2  ORF type:complete len:139 (-),score=10.84 TRINITY_DN36115_c0_g1_i1:278-694(-)
MERLLEFEWKASKIAKHKYISTKQVAFLETIRGFPCKDASIVDIQKHDFLSIQSNIHFCAQILQNIPSFWSKCDRTGTVRVNDKTNRNYCSAFTQVNWKSGNPFVPISKFPNLFKISNANDLQICLVKSVISISSWPI